MPSWRLQYRNIFRTVYLPLWSKKMAVVKPQLVSFLNHPQIGSALPNTLQEMYYIRVSAWWINPALADASQKMFVWNLSNSLPRATTPGLLPAIGWIVAALPFGLLQNNALLISIQQGLKNNLDVNRLCPRSQVQDRQSTEKVRIVNLNVFCQPVPRQYKSSRKFINTDSLPYREAQDREVHHHPYTLLLTRTTPASITSSVQWPTERYSTGNLNVTIWSLCWQRIVHRDQCYPSTALQTRKTGTLNVTRRRRHLQRRQRLLNATHPQDYQKAQHRQTRSHMPTFLVPNTILASSSSPLYLVTDKCGIAKLNVTRPPLHWQAQQRYLNVTHLPTHWHAQRQQAESRASTPLLKSTTPQTQRYRSTAVLARTALERSLSQVYLRSDMQEAGKLNIIRWHGY